MAKEYLEYNFLGQAPICEICFNRTEDEQGDAGCRKDYNGRNDKPLLERSSDGLDDWSCSGHEEIIVTKLSPGDGNKCIDCTNQLNPERNEIHCRYDPYAKLIKYSNGYKITEKCNIYSFPNIEAGEEELMEAIEEEKLIEAKTA